MPSRPASTSRSGSSHSGGEEGESLSPLEEAQRSLRRYIKAHALRNTPERRLVLERAYTIEQPFSAEALRQDVAQTHMVVSMATIYNCLDLFAKLGLVARVLWGDHVVYARTLGEPPVRVLQCCTLCGKVVRLDGSGLDAALDGVPFVRFRRQATIVCSNGLCAQCRSTETRLRNSYLKHHWWEEEEF